MKPLLLWFSVIDDFSSFSRISYEMIKLLVNKYDIILLSNDIHAIKNDNSENLKKLGVQIIRIGESSSNISLEEFSESWVQMRDNNLNLEFKIKYSIVQMADIINEKKPAYTVICNGVYEINYILQIIKESDKECKMGSVMGSSKLVVWTPIDVIPKYETISNLFYADLLITMTPVMSNILRSLYDNKHSIEMAKEFPDKLLKKCKITDVGHGSYNLKNSLINISRKNIVKYLNSKIDVLWTGQKLSEDDIIILNANNYVPRKQIKQTIEIFNKLCDKLKISDQKMYGKIKLWIHTDLKSFLKELKETVSNSVHKHKIILSNNNVSDDVLNNIYRVSQIGIQTSNGEGWSLTNCEHALYESTQIVPDFLATGYHFKNRGVLVPVTIITNDNGDFVSSFKTDDFVNALEKELYNSSASKETINYFRTYTWENFSNKFINELEKLDA